MANPSRNLSSSAPTSTQTPSVVLAAELPPRLACAGSEGVAADAAEQVTELAEALGLTGDDTTGDASTSDEGSGGFGGSGGETCFGASCIETGCAPGLVCAPHPDTAEPLCVTLCAPPFACNEVVPFACGTVVVECRVDVDGPAMCFPVL